MYLSWRVPTVLCLALALPAHAQVPTTHPFKTSAGKSIQLTIYGAVTESCEDAPVPTVQIAHAPANGMLTIRMQRLPVPAGAAQCGGKAIPILVLYYTPADGFTGVDQIAIRAGVMGQPVRSQKIVVEVTPSTN